MTNPPRIVFVAPFGLGEKTTVWARTFPLARYLVHQGCQVTIAIPPWDTPADAGRTWVDSGVRLIHTKLHGGPLAVLWRLLRIVDGVQPDIVHIVKPRAYAGLVQWWLWQRRRVRNRGPLIFLDVDDWEQAWAPINGYAWPLARGLAWQEEWGIRHANGVTAASRWLVERITAYAPNMPVLYLPNGVAQPPQQRETSSVTSETPLADREQLRILFFTRFVEVEPGWLGEFWRALLGRAPRARLVIAGRAIRPGLQSEFRRRLGDADEGVDWQENVTPDTLDELYAQVDCAIFPTANIPLHQAKCSVRLANTLLRGVPVVASAVGEQIEYGGDGAACLVAADATPAQFAETVVAVLHRPERQRELAERARRRLLTRYDWARLGSQLEEFYERVSVGDDHG